MSETIINGSDHLLDDIIDPNSESIILDNTEPIIPENNRTTVKDDNILYSLLKFKGIEDPSKLKFENEDGNIEEIDFNTLPTEEQLTILQEMTDSGLSDHEVEVVNYLRSNNTTLNEVIDYFAEKRLQEYLTNNPDQVKQPTYSIDDYTDEDLYYADLKSKYPKFSEEELEKKLNLAKNDVDLFKKEVDILRDFYKQQEDEAKREEENKEAQEYEDLRNTLINTIANFNEISLDYTDPKSDTLLIEESDKQKTLAYLLTKDKEGKTKFVRDIEDPEQLIQLAWFMTHGNDIISGISQYWKELLKEERKQTKKQTKPTETQRINSNAFKLVEEETKKKGGDYDSIWANSGLI